jgi:hypothetical protein
MGQLIQLSPSQSERGNWPMHLTNNFNRIRDIFRGMFTAPGIETQIDIEYPGVQPGDDGTIRRFNVWVETNSDNPECREFQFNVDIDVDALSMDIWDRGVMKCNAKVLTIPLWFSV